MPTPWHYTTLVDLLDHWQSLIAGALAFLAASAAVVATWELARQATSGDADALRKSLAAELRILVPQALGVHESLGRLAQRSGQKITTRMIEHLSHLSPPVVYMASASKVGMLGYNLIPLMQFYALLRAASDAVQRIMQYRTPDDVSSVVVAGLAESFLAPCQLAAPLLLNFRTGVPQYDDQDEHLATLIANATVSWQKVKQDRAELGG
jgi:hypothetical protein